MKEQNEYNEFTKRIDIKLMSIFGIFNKWFDKIIDIAGNIRNKVVSLNNEERIKFSLTDTNVSFLSFMVSIIYGSISMVLILLSMAAIEVFIVYVSKLFPDVISVLVFFFSSIFNFGIGIFFALPTLHPVICYVMDKLILKVINRELDILKMHLYLVPISIFIVFVYYVIVWLGGLL